MKKIKQRKVSSIWDIIDDPELHFFQKVDYIRHHFVYYDGNYELFHDKNGRPTHTKKLLDQVDYLTASEEQDYYISQATVGVDDNDMITDAQVAGRYNGENVIIPAEKVDYIDVSPLGLVTTLLNNFRGILNIQLNPKCTAKDVGMSDKQFFVVKKYNCGFYNRDQLVKIMEVLTNVEYKFKYEEFPVSMLIDYVVCNILGA